MKIITSKINGKEGIVASSNSFSSRITYKGQKTSLSTSNCTQTNAMLFSPMQSSTRVGQA